MPQQLKLQERQQTKKRRSTAAANMGRPTEFPAGCCLQHLEGAEAGPGVLRGVAAHVVAEGRATGLVQKLATSCTPAHVPHTLRHVFASFYCPGLVVPHACMR